mgnify:CR=1 FL=1
MPALTQVQMALIAAALAVAAFGGWLMIHDTKTVNRERARVEAQGSKIDAKAQQKRAAAESKPDLSRWMRD